MRISRRYRWGVLLVIIVASVIVVWAIQVRGWHISHPARDIVLACGLINLLFYGWIRLCTGLSLSRQAVVVVVMVALQAICVSLLRVDGYHGDGRLITKWKWQPTPEQQLADYDEQTSGEIRTPVLGIRKPTDSPAFRGADGSGQFVCENLVVQWDQKPPKELWRRPVGQGWSSFAVVNGFCVTQETRGEKETVVCYDAKNGRETWVRSIDKLFHEVTSGRGPRSTPAIHDGNVFALSGHGKLTCLRGTDGEPVWSRDLSVPDTEPNLFGFCGSPLVHHESVYVMLGGSHGSIVALNRNTGDVQWKNGERRGSYSSPALFKMGGQTAVVIHDAVGLFAYDSISGKQLCKFDWGKNSDEQVNACQPAVVDENHVLLSSGYGVGSVLVQIDREDESKWSVSEVWSTIQLKSKFQSIVIRDGYAYGLDEGILTCIDLQTGQRTWKRGRHGHGQLILVNDSLVIQNESGDISVVQINPKRYELIATIPALGDRTWNHPVVADGRLYVRNDREAICFMLPTSRD